MLRHALPIRTHRPCFPAHSWAFHAPKCPAAPRFTLRHCPCLFLVCRTLCAVSRGSPPTTRCAVFCIRSPLYLLLLPFYPTALACRRFPAPRKGVSLYHPHLAGFCGRTHKRDWATTGPGGLGGGKSPPLPECMGRAVYMKMSLWRSYLRARLCACFFCTECRRVCSPFIAQQVVINLPW